MNKEDKESYLMLLLFSVSVGLFMGFVFIAAHFIPWWIGVIIGILLYPLELVLLGNLMGD